MDFSAALGVCAHPRECASSGAPGLPRRGLPVYSRGHVTRDETGHLPLDPDGEHAFDLASIAVLMLSISDLLIDLLVVSLVTCLILDLHPL